MHLFRNNLDILTTKSPSRVIPPFQFKINPLWSPFLPFFWLWDAHISLVFFLSLFFSFLFFLPSAQSRSVCLYVCMSGKTIMQGVHCTTQCEPPSDFLNLFILSVSIFHFHQGEPRIAIGKVVKMKSSIVRQLFVHRQSFLLNNLMAWSSCL